MNKEETHEIIPGNIDTSQLLPAKGFQPIYTPQGAWMLFSTEGGPTVGVHEDDLLKAAEVIVTEKPKTDDNNGSTATSQ